MISQAWRLLANVSSLPSPSANEALHGMRACNQRARRFKLSSPHHSLAQSRGRRQRPSLPRAREPKQESSS
jgi:hypothetical protein